MFELIETIIWVIAISSIIASLTPTKKDDVFMAKVLKYVDVLALNIGQVRKRLLNKND